MKSRLFGFFLALSPVACGQGSPSVKHPEVDEVHLKGIVRTKFDSPNPTEAQLARKSKSIAAVKEMGLPAIEHLPVVEDESTITPRSPQVVAKRCIATAFCAVKGETDDNAFVAKVVIEYSAENYFSPKESAFIKAKKVSQQQLLDFSWRYECVHVFLWALGKHDKLAAPNQICTVPEEMELLRKEGHEKFVSNAKLRPMSEILDMADLYYRLHWAAIDLRLKKKHSDTIDEGIIRERHRALNWLIRYLSQEWDDVTTDT